MRGGLHKYIAGVKKNSDHRRYGPFREIWHLGVETQGFQWSGKSSVGSGNTKNQTQEMTEVTKWRTGPKQGWAINLKPKSLPPHGEKKILAGGGAGDEIAVADGGAVRDDVVLRRQVIPSTTPLT